MQESTLTVQLVHGGFILTTPNDLVANARRTEVFPTQAKLIKAIRAAVEKYSLVAKTKVDGDGDA